MGTRGESFFNVFQRRKMCVQRFRIVFQFAQLFFGSALLSVALLSFGFQVPRNYAVEDPNQLSH